VSAEAAGATESKGRPTPSREGRQGKVSLFRKMGRFFREVVAELRKVIWPTRRQLMTYTLVVLVFISVVVAVVAGLDMLFAQGVLWLFG
jgi:preprotein translocase subunit SecE